MIASFPAKCAKTPDEFIKMFPKEHALIKPLRGTWSDLLTGDYEERVFQFQQKHPDNYKKNDEVKIQVKSHSFKIDFTEGSFRFQLLDFNEEAKLSRSIVETAELCQGPDGFFVKSQKINIPIKFQGPKCLWVSMNGEWRGLRQSSSEAPDFLPQASRETSPAQRKEGAK